MKAEIRDRGPPIRKCKIADRSTVVDERFGSPEILMARPAAPLAFPTWREVWVSLEGVPELLSAADATLRRRMAGNQRMPQRNSSDSDDVLSLAVHALRRWAEDEPPQDPTARPDIVRRIYGIVSTALPTMVWPRWLFLERAFLDASATGDLLFAALVLRTMCEEVQRQHAMDLPEDELASLAASSVPADQERLRLFLSVAWTALSALPQDMVLDGKGWPSLKLMETAMPRLESARRSLNSYVHPNYGSHIAALFPERASAARLLLEAVVALYEAFFALSWAEEPISGQSKSLGVGPSESWSRSVRRLLSRTLPELRQSHHNQVMAEVMKVPAVIEWINAARDDLVGMLNEPTTALLLGDLPQRSNYAAVNDAALRYLMWDGARVIDVLGLASARRAEKLLADEFSLGAPDPVEQVLWLRFNAQSLQLAMLIDQVKAAAFKTQLVRQITQGNIVGVWLCVRSLIEHRALAVWLTKEVGVSLDALASELKSEMPLPKSAAAVEQPLTNFLAAQAKGSKEELRSWVIGKTGVRTAWLNLSKVVESAFTEDDRFRVIYALASGALHGRSVRGIDLGVNFTNNILQARRVGLLVLERLCGRDEEMDHLSLAITQSIRFEHAAEFGGTPSATTDIMAQQAFGLLSEMLSPGVDYSGEGTVDSPFCVSSHLEFYQTSYAILKQIGIDVTTCHRTTDHDRAGHLCDRWSAPNRDYWFQAQVPASLLS